MDLEQETRRRMQECFGGQTCFKCGRPAVRLARERFYCERHFPYGGTRSHASRRTYKAPPFWRNN